MPFKPRTFHEEEPEIEKAHPVDALLETNVADHVATAADLDATAVTVTAIGGLITLGGFTNSEEEKLRAGEIAAEIPEVSQVENIIQVRGPTLS